MAALLNAIEEEVAFPARALFNLVAMFPKPVGDGAKGNGQLPRHDADRPIGLMQMLVRL